MSYLELKEAYAKIESLEALNRSQEEEIANSNKFAQDQENKIKLMENVITGLQIEKDELKEDAVFSAEYIHDCMADYNGLLDDYKELERLYYELKND